MKIIAHTQLFQFHTSGGFGGKHIFAAESHLLIIAGIMISSFDVYHLHNLISVWPPCLVQYHLSHFIA